MSRKLKDAVSLGKRGGEKTKSTRPADYYEKIGAKGNEAIKQKYAGTDFFKERSRKATEARLKKKAAQQEAEAKKHSPFHKLSDILSGK